MEYAGNRYVHKSPAAQSSPFAGAHRNGYTFNVLRFMNSLIISVNHVVYRSEIASRDAARPNRKRNYVYDLQRSTAHSET